MGAKILSLISQQILYADFLGCDGRQTTGSTKKPLDSLFKVHSIGIGTVQTVQFGFTVPRRSRVGIFFIY